MSKAVMIAKQTFLQELASARVIMGYLLGLAFLAAGLENFWHFVIYRVLLIYYQIFLYLLTLF